MKAGDAGAAGRVRLKHIHGPRLQHAAEICAVVAVFACTDFHARRRPVAHQPQALEIVA